MLFYASNFLPFICIKLIHIFNQHFFYFNLKNICFICFLNVKRVQFPHGDKLPANNLPVSTFGQVPRDQRQKELEFFLNKQYNTIGLKIQNRINSVEKQLQTGGIVKEQTPGNSTSSMSHHAPSTIANILQPAMSGSSVTFQSASTAAQEQ